MEWLDNIIAILFIAVFAYELVRQITKSLSIAKTVPWDSANNKRLIVGNHLFTLTLAGFVVSLIINLAVYNYTIPQPHGTANAASLTAFYCLLGMLIAKLGIIPKEQGPKKLSSNK